MNRVKVWIFTLLVVGAGAAALLFHARALRHDALASLDARLAAGAGQASTSLRASLREAAAGSAVAARAPELRAAFSSAEAGSLPRKPRDKVPGASGDGARDEVALQSAARTALAAAERALGGELPAGRMVLAADLAGLSRRAIGGDADALLRGAAEGTARAGYARGDGKLWAAAGVPAGEGAGVVVLVPIGEAWARAVTTASGVDATVAGVDLKATGTAPATEQVAITGAATRSPGKVVDVGVLAPVEVGMAWLPVQLPKVGMLLGEAPAHRVRAVPVEGLKGAAVVLSVSAAPELSRVVVLQWRGLAALTALLLLGLLFGLLVKPSEIVPAVPEPLVAAAARIERGDFASRAPQLAGKLGTIAAALNRAAEAAQGGGGGQQPTPAPGSITQEFFNPPAPPEAEPSAFDFPARPPRQRPVEAEPRPAGARLSGDPFQAAPVASRPSPPLGDMGTPAEVLQAAARGGPPPIPNATMTRTMPAVSVPDDETAHWQQVFQDFVRTRGECGEASEGLTFERFRQKLESNKATLIAKYQCKTVRFQVYVKDGKAALKATPVR